MAIEQIFLNSLKNIKKNPLLMRVISGIFLKIHVLDKIFKQKSMFINGPPKNMFKK